MLLLKQLPLKPLQKSLVMLPLLQKAAADKAVADAKAEAIKAVQAEIETLKKK